MHVRCDDCSRERGNNVVHPDNGWIAVGIEHVFVDVFYPHFRPVSLILTIGGANTRLDRGQPCQSKGLGVLEIQTERIFLVIDIVSDMPEFAEGIEVCLGENFAVVIHDTRGLVRAVDQSHLGPALVGSRRIGGFQHRIDRSPVELGLRI